MERVMVAVITRYSRPSVLSKLQSHRHQPQNGIATGFSSDVSRLQCDWLPRMVEARHFSVALVTSLPIHLRKVHGRC